eukprot:jgi/Phyca11/12611/fgenesh1_pg.PHYCAscaffold_1_\
MDPKLSFCCAWAARALAKRQTKPKGCVRHTQAAQTPDGDCQLDVLGDITEVLHDFLGSQSPTLLLNDVSLAPKTDASTPPCVTLPSPSVTVRLPSLSPSSVAAPQSPSNLASGESVAETVISSDSPLLATDGLIYSGHWSLFCLAQKKIFSNGVLTREIDAFFNFIRAEGAPLDYLQLFQKVRKFSTTTGAELERKARVPGDDLR